MSLKKLCTNRLDVSISIDFQVSIPSLAGSNSIVLGNELKMF